MKSGRLQIWVPELIAREGGIQSYSIEMVEAAAEILGRGADVHDDPRRSDAGPLQHVFGSLVGRSAAGGDGVGPRGPPEEVGVGDGRTDRIRIRIAMPEDEDAHGKTDGCVGWAGRR